MAAALLASAAMLLCLASSASALNYAMNFRNYDPNQLETTKRSGATVFRTELDFTCTGGGSNWGQFDPIIKAAWERGITILPVLVRSYPACENAEHKRFLNSGDGNWGKWDDWAREAVERYGINGSYWNGKANPTPITAWEVGNEPNLAQNNPGGTVVQPQAYGEFLSYTANALQAGSITKTAHGTEVISAGLLSFAGFYYGRFLEEMGHTNAYTAVGFHPYYLYNSASGVGEAVTNLRNVLSTHVTGGGSKPIWLTELGWNVAGTEGMPSGSSPVSEQRQAELLHQSFDWVQANAGSQNIALLTWYKIQDQSANGNHWDEHTGLLRFDGTYRPSWFAYQEETGAPKWPTYEQFISLQANTNQMWHYSSNSGGSWWNTSSGIEPGTSPSTAFVPNVGYVSAFQDWNHQLYLYLNSSKSWVNTKLGMQPGTSPSIAVKPDGSYIVAFQANTGKLWYYDSAAGGGINTTSGMDATTSPSAVYVPNLGSYVIAFQDQNHYLWSFTTANSNWNNTKLGMRSNTDPSIAVKSDGEYVMAMQANDGDLWTYTPSGGGVDRNLGVQLNTNPSIATAPSGGDYIVAFHANTDVMWYFSSANGGAYNTTSGIAANTSPSVAYLSDAKGYAMAFQAWEGKLFTYSTASASWVNTTLGMAPSTSPSLVVN